MSDADKTGSTGPRMSLEDLERDIAARSPPPSPPPPPAAAKPAPTPKPVRQGGAGGLLGATALLISVGAAGLSAYGYWRQMTMPAPIAAADTDLSPLLSRIASVETQQQKLKSTLDTLSRRQDALEAKLGGDIPQAPRQDITAETDSEPGTSTTDNADLADLTERVTALEGRKQAKVDLEPLTNRMETLEEVTAEVIPRLTMLETRRQMGAVGEALIIAVGQLQSALIAGRPYGRELRAAQALAANDTGLQDLLAPLAATADTGLTGDIELREKFRLLAPAVLRADRDREGADWKDRVLGRLSSVITFRRASGEVAGDDADAVLARAEAALIANDLPRAVEELEKLPAHAAGPAAEWLTLAEARMAAEAAAATLADLSLARMTGAAGSQTGNGKDGEAR